MSAEKSEIPANKQLDLIERFNAEYEAAMIDARRSAEHTATEGWLDLYRMRRESYQADRRRQAERLRALADTLESAGLDEDGEKAIGEVKKECCEMREAMDHWRLLTVGPVREPVDRLEAIIRQARAQAHRDEADAPLVNVGLVELMNMAIKEVHKATWNDETGRVIC